MRRRPCWLIIWNMIKMKIKENGMMVNPLSTQEYIKQNNTKTSIKRKWTLWKWSDDKTKQHIRTNWEKKWTSQFDAHYEKNERMMIAKSCDIWVQRLMKGYARKYGVTMRPKIIMLFLHIDMNLTWLSQCYGNTFAFCNIFSCVNNHGNNHNHNIAHVS